MVCATSAIDTGPARVGHVAGKITLPRTVELPTAIATVAGAFVGLIVAATIPGGSIQKWVFSILFFAAVGYFLMNFSPMRGESLAKWLGLQVSTLRRSRMVNGKPVIIAIGSKVASREVLGEFRLVRSAVHVPVGAYDERGVFKSVKNRNLDPEALSAAEMGSGGGRTAPLVVSSPVSGPVSASGSPSGVGSFLPAAGNAVDTRPTLEQTEGSPASGVSAEPPASEPPAWARMRSQQPVPQQPVPQQPGTQAQTYPQPGAATQPGYVPQQQSPLAPTGNPQPGTSSPDAPAARPGLPEGAPPWARQLAPEPEPSSKPGRRRKERGK